MINVGESAEASLTVQRGDTTQALAVSSEDSFPEVFATSRMIALMEVAAARLMRPMLQPGELSVGVGMNLFTQPRRVAPPVALLADALRPYEVAGVCGPLVGGAFFAQITAAALDVEFAFTEPVMPAAPDGLYPPRRKFRSWGSRNR